MSQQVFIEPAAGTGERVTEQAIYNMVVEYAKVLRFAKLAPHDLHRTFAKLAHKGGSRLDQIQLSLGHSSIQTTERYLGTDQDLTDAPCDHFVEYRLGFNRIDQVIENAVTKWKLDFELIVLSQRMFPAEQSPELICHHKSWDHVVL